MNLTKLQKEIIQHRLDVTDAMADVMYDEYSALFSSWNECESEIISRAKTLIDKLVKGSDLDDIELHMVEDIVSDEVFVDLSDGADPDECSSSKAAGIRRSHEYLCTKLIKLLEVSNEN
jgi:hypothetical protein